MTFLEAYALYGRDSAAIAEACGIDNIIKPVSDALVAAGVVSDDSLAEEVRAKWADNLGGPAVVVLICAAEEELAA